MAQLKGRTWDKQIKDINFRLAAFGTPRNGTNSNKTHSDSTRIKRDNYLSDFKKYAEDKELDGKLNQLMTEENLTEMLSDRLDNLSFSTQEDYIRGWSGMVQGLQCSNIDINLDTPYFNALVADYREEAIDRGESLGDPKAITTSFHPNYVMGELSEPLGVVAQLQYETGIRVSEAYSVIQDLEKHLSDLKLLNIIGKGGQKYNAKIISLELRLMLLKLRQKQTKLPVQSTYYRQLQRFGMSSHDIRAFYTKELYDYRVESGLTHKEACEFVSKEINHHRIQITEYYLAKFA
jgi:hypothetical protein